MALKKKNENSELWIEKAKTSPAFEYKCSPIVSGGMYNGELFKLQLDETNWNVGEIFDSFELIILTLINQNQKFLEVFVNQCCFLKKYARVNRWYSLPI